MQIALYLFVVFTIVGAFSAWRRSPLYSLKATLQLVGAMSLIVAAIVAVGMAILDGPLKQLPLAQGIVGFVAMLGLTTGSMILIVRITDRHVAQLPADTKLVTFNRHKVMRWVWRLGIFVLVTAAAGLVLPETWNWLPIALDGFLLLLCGPMLAIFYMMARRNDRGMTAVIASPWTHWQYSPEQWQSWAKNQLEWEKAQEGPWSWKAALLLNLFCDALFLVGALFSGGSLKENTAIVIGLAGSLIALTLVGYWFKSTNFERRYRRLLAAAPDAYFGDEGVFCNGDYAPWILSGRYLLKATTARGPVTCVVLVFQSYSGSSSVLITKRIPVPESHLADLKLLQEKIDARCPTASVHLAAS